MTGLDIPTGCHGNALISKGSEDLGRTTPPPHHSLLTHKENWDVLFDHYALFLDTLFLKRSKE